MVLVSPFVPFTFGMGGYLLICMVSLKQVFDSFVVLSTSQSRFQSFVKVLGFVNGVIGLGGIWGLGFMTGFGQILYHLLPFLLSKICSFRYLGFCWNSISSMLIYARPGCLFVLGLVILLLLFINYWILSVIFFIKNPQFDFHRITGRDLQEVARAEKSTASGLNGWAWNDIKDISFFGISGLAILLMLVETIWNWLQGSLDDILQ